MPHAGINVYPSLMDPIKSVSIQILGKLEYARIHCDYCDDKRLRVIKNKIEKLKDEIEILIWFDGDAKTYKEIKKEIRKES